MSAGRSIAVVPAFNEEAAIGPRDRRDHRVRPVVRRRRRRRRLRGRHRALAAPRTGAPSSAPLQPRHRRRRPDRVPLRPRARLRPAVRLDGDGQHDPPELAEAARRARRGEADIVTGSRFPASDDGTARPSRRRIGITWFARLVSLLARQRVTDTTSGLPGAQPQGDRALRRRLPERLPRGGGDHAGAQAPAPPARGAREMREREHGSSSITLLRSLYYVIKVTARALRRRWCGGTPCRRRGVATVTPVSISIAAAIASLLLHPRRPRADPGSAAEGALRAALARDRRRPARPVGLARRPQHDRGLVRRRDLPAGDPLRRRDPVRHRRPAALLDRALAAHRHNTLLAQEVALLRTRIDALESRRVPD